MSQFNYTLPSGAKFTLDAPEGTTQTQADYTFYSQVAAGALVGFKPGQTVTGTTSNLAKFALSRQDRGIAGVEDFVVLSIINGLPTVASIPTLVDVPLVNPVTQANIATIGGSGFTASSIGSLTSNQVQALLAQIVNIVDQSANTMTNSKGVGQYGFDCQQLEMAGYVKPGTWQEFIRNGRSTLVDVLSAPGIWTGLGGIFSVTDFLNNPVAQNKAEEILMIDAYNSLQAAGIITTPDAESLSAVVGHVYTGSNQPLVLLNSTLTNTVNNQVASLVTNASQYGTQLTSQWATGLAPVSSITSNLTSIRGQIGSLPGLPDLGTLTSSLTPALSTVKTAMDTLGKASQFAASASSTLTSGLDKLSNLSVDNLAGQLQGQATAIAGQLQAQATAIVGQIQGQANALIGQIQGQFASLIGQGDSFVESVQRAAGFTNTVSRAPIDVAFKKILGSSKIPTPSFGAYDISSIGAELDISQAQGILQNLQNQGTALVSQVQGIANQAQGTANNLISSVNRLI